MNSVTHSAISAYKEIKVLSIESLLWVLMRIGKVFFS